ncbi:AAA family ATPase [Candidatus Woesearchaeota archaeon]|nr:AAA family ATPase [Candidatus Woesearchaeota archaeon]
MKITSEKEYQKTRIPLYIKGLDDQIEGGIPEGHVVLLCGSAGTMKSTVSFNILYNEALKGNSSIYFSLEQPHENFLHHIFNLGYDLSKVNFIVITDLSSISSELTKLKKEKKGTIFFIDISAVRKELQKARSKSGDWVNAIENIAKRIKSIIELKLLVIDSLSALYIHADFKEPRKKIFFIFETFRDMGITSLMISEMHLDRMKYADFEVEDFLADGVIVLFLTERHRKVTREISVVKMRGTSCNHNVFTLDFKKGQFKALYGGEIPLVE